MSLLEVDAGAARRDRALDGKGGEASGGLLNE